MASSKQNRWRLHNVRLVSAILVILMAYLTGCSGIGPKSVSRDRFDYVNAISESWKRQTLLNLLKTRYADAPVFMDVASVINQYAVEGELQLGLTWANPDTQTLQGTTRYTDRPTITYNPLVGEKFSRSMMTPLPIAGVLFLVQAGYPADYVFRVGVQAINGLKNRTGGTMTGRPADPEFLELLKILRRMQDSGQLGMRIKPLGKEEALVMIFRDPSKDAIEAEFERARQLLGLLKGQVEFRVRYGSLAMDDQEIAILTRSMLQIMIEYASYIEVPASEIAEGRAGAVRQDSADFKKNFPPLLRVKNGSSKPDDAYVSARYRNRWFWIADTDFHSKQTFYFLMLLFSLTERGGGQGAPVVTVPTN